MGSGGIDRYCRWLSYYFHVPGLDPDDLYQEACIAAWLAPGHERIAARRQMLDLIKISQRRPRTTRLTAETAVSPDVIDTVITREQLRAVVDAPLTRHEAIALGRAARGEPIQRHEKALGVAYWRARRRLRYSEF